MYMHNHRSLLNGTPLDARHTNVALEARKSGYEPALFGYTDVSLDPELGIFLMVMKGFCQAWTRFACSSVMVGRGWLTSRIRDMTFPSVKKH
jgi:hypothetical protein